MEIFKIQRPLAGEVQMYVYNESREIVFFINKAEQSEFYDSLNDLFDEDEYKIFVNADHRQGTFDIDSISEVEF